MNILRISAAAFIILTFFRCVDSTKPTGSNDVQVISNLSFEVTERTTSSSKLTASGTVTNNGKNTIYPPWFVEGDFYADETYKFKFGGDYFEINYSLGKGETTSWILQYSSGFYTESDYPSFGVKNLRGYKDD